MKANKVPEKIYLQVCGDCHGFNCDTCKFEDLEDNVTWCKERIFKRDIEYTRTDAFIEKACKFISDRVDIIFNVECPNGEPLADSYIEYVSARLDAANKIIDEFKKYMEE